jgi:hypothetical protein
MEIPQMEDYVNQADYIKLDPQSDEFRRATRRARVLRPHVRALSVVDRVYEVRSGRGEHSYRCRLAYACGQALALCECRAGQDGQLCYHAVSALSLAVGIKAARKAVQA